MSNDCSSTPVVDLNAHIFLDKACCLPIYSACDSNISMYVSS